MSQDLMDEMVNMSFEIIKLKDQRRELLEALKLMTDRFLDTEGNHGSYEQVAMDAAYAAIAKAEGANT